MATIEDLTPHARNANAGTERGAVQIEESIKKYGFGRSILVDKNGQIIAGNHVVENATPGTKIRIIETDGSELVVHKRTDLDLNAGVKAVELAYADNRASEVGLKWDREVIEADLKDQVDLASMFLKDELDEILNAEKKDQKDDKITVTDVVIKLTFNGHQLEEFNAASVALMRKWNETASESVVLRAMLEALK